ncbi:MAG: FKBP-type peptidyl-prolyl cis-trans isomerase [Bryobacteraceae bacterium]|nr:FKBP-type peptidyl-prolyl cis-trans isomerase [Bryobacteraceae bacterium]
MLAAFLLFQAFTPDLPSSIPSTQNPIVELATFRYIDLTEGSGALAKPGQKYTVHYTGWLRDGTKFDSSVDRKDPLDFVQGRRQVIAGWEMGFQGMKTGGKRRLFIPHQLAYGEKGSGPIPPNSELIFDVELLSVADVKELPPSAELLGPFDEYRDKILALAKALPEDKLGYRPAPGVRSTGEVLTHIALGLALMSDIAFTQPAKDVLDKRVAAMLSQEIEARSKEQLLALLQTTFTDVRKAIEPLRAGALAREAQFFNEQTTRRGIMIYIDTHLAEHLGQLIAYARVNGIVPPWSNPVSK